MRLNPIALAFWLFSGLIGYLIDGTHGAVIGLTVAVGISLLSCLLPTRRW